MARPDGRKSTAGEAPKAVTAAGNISVGPRWSVGRKIISRATRSGKVQASTWSKEEDRFAGSPRPQQRRRVGVRCEGGHPSQSRPARHTRRHQYEKWRGYEGREIFHTAFANRRA